MNLNFLKKSNFNIKKAMIYEKAYEKILELQLFDENFYRKYYKGYFNGDALIHYLFEGYKKNFDPSKNFNTEKYLNTYPDVKKGDMNPLAHYALYGINEGRKIFLSINYMKEEISDKNLQYLHNYKFSNEPLVSIIILNRNGLTHLKRLFNDFSKKTDYSNFECIIVDNNSDDSSVDYLKSLNVNFPLKIIENDENMSFSKANNESCKIANGEYILLLNNDIEPTFGWLNEMMGVMLNNDNVGSVGAKLVFPYYENKPKQSYKIQHSGDILSFRKKPYTIYAYNQNKFADPFDSKVNDLKKVVSVTAAAILIKKSIYEEVGGLDEGYIYGYEDVDFSLKLNQRGYDIWYCPSALLFHHESSTRNVSLNSDNNYSRLNSKWWNYLNRNIFIDKIDNNKFFCEKPLNFLFIVKDINEIPENALKLAEKLKDESYIVDFNVNSDNIKINGAVDVIISFTSNLNENIDIRDNTVKILFLENEEIENDYYDIIIHDDANFMKVFKDYIYLKYGENEA